MTETQAKAGAAAAGPPGKSGAPASEAPASAGSKGPADGGKGRTGGAEDAGPSVVGRAVVPPGERGPTVGVKYTRPPGMAPPPDVPQGSSGVPSQSASPAGQGATGVIPAVARASVRAGGAAASPQPGGGLSGGQPSASATTSIISSGRVTEAVRAARATVSAAVGRGPRRARLHVKRIDPWSVMKFSFAVSFVLFVVVIVATSVLYLALDAMGVFGSLNKALIDMIGATGGDTSSIKITAKGIIGGAALIGLVNVVLFTALATLSAFIYNVCADLVGGIELTLAEKD